MSNVIDLYAGAGGLSLGASRAGFNVIAAVEIDKHAMATHRINFPKTNHIEKDIMTTTIDDINEAVHNASIVGVIGGPPCQGFSTMGHGNVNDNRNQLFNRFFELVSELQPCFFLAENVPGIMRERYKSIRDNAFNLVSGSYRILDPLLVRASDYGAPTTRTRYFFIGIRKDIETDLSNDSFLSAQKTNQKTTVKAALEGLPIGTVYTKDQTGICPVETDYFDRRRKHIQSKFYYERITDMIPNGIGNTSFIQAYKKHHVTNGLLLTKHADSVISRYKQIGYGEQDTVSRASKLDPDSFCPTLRAGTGPDKGSFQAVRPIHYLEPRVITPREAARLQGFPDWFELPNTIWHSFRQIGNSVSPIAAEMILKVIFDHLPTKYQKT